MTKSAYSMSGNQKVISSQRHQAVSDPEDPDLYLREPVATAIFHDRHC
jgi:hypothetical protein